jgi:hypothetical protein
MSQYSARPSGPVKYTSISGTNIKLRLILYLNPSLAIHDPRKRFKAKKCNQKKSKKFSVANVVYRSSKLKYNLKMFNIGSSSKIV